MITIFNRKEVFITFGADEYFRIKNILKDRNIEIYVKIHGRNDHNRGRNGSFGIDTEHACEYIIFVKRCDYDRAIYFINQNR